MNLFDGLNNYIKKTSSGSSSSAHRLLRKRERYNTMDDSKKTKSIERNEGLYKGYENYYTSVHAGCSIQCPKHRFVHTCSNTPNQRLKTTTRCHHITTVGLPPPLQQLNGNTDEVQEQYLVRACT
jgi:hypothetical protein